METQPYLRGVTFVRKHYKAPSSKWDHDHCVACWAKFGEFDGPEIQHEGYATTEAFVHGADYDWVYLECFGLFCEPMDWKEAKSSESKGTTD